MALSGQLEIFSWWTAGGEGEGKEALFEIYREKYPDVEIIDATVAGGAGMNAQAVLATRMSAGDPPDTFQVHAGHELIDTYGVADLLEPVNFIFEEEGWFDFYPDDMISILSSGDDILSVPVNIHRSNVLWYNKAVFEANSITVPTTFDEFFAAADTLQAAGITPLALGDTGIWTAVHVFENVLLGTLGPADYIGLFDGSVAWDSAKVKDAIQTFVDMLDYVNSDHSALAWDEAAQYVIDGTAAMTIMGDWAEGFFKSKGLTPDVEFGYEPAPGTSGSFMALSDTFCLPKNVKDRENTIAWLKICGSKEGQDAFNPLKGSIPARTDPDLSLYDVYLQGAIADFGSNSITPSIAHGAAVSQTWSQAINDIMTLLVSDKDVEAAAVAFQAAADENL
ncbi:MAG: ABC transporter substrate-binding protein [Actinomycetota bacterium]|nr:ABC transporter substrate-binding protein [Actinomycetota bacterium]